MQRETQATISATAVKIANMALGTVITHDVMSEMLLVSREDRQYYQRVRKLRSELQHCHKIFLLTKPTIGYYAASHGQEIEACKGKRDRGVRYIIESLADTRDIPIDRFSDPELVTKTVTEQNKMATLSNMLANAYQIEANKTVAFYKLR